jgi:excisionase family DNA binding protein
MTDKLLTMEEAAERLRTTPRHVRRLVFERRIAYRKVGRFVRFHPEDLAEYVAAQRIEVARPAVGRLRAVAGGRGSSWATWRICGARSRARVGLGGGHATVTRRGGSGPRASPARWTLSGS